nr:hypothetical protein [Pirellula staleyi]
MSQLTRFYPRTGLGIAPLGQLPFTMIDRPTTTLSHNRNRLLRGAYPKQQTERS